MRKGHWSEHEYHRRKCAQEGGDFTGFIGWKRLTALVESLDKRTEDLFLVLFFTGARANELLLYKGMNFKITDETVDVVSAPAFKKFRHKRFDRDQVWGYRHFAINRQEPLTNNLIGFIEPKREDKPIFDFSYSTV